MTAVVAHKRSHCPEPELKIGHEVPTRSLSRRDFFRTALQSEFLQELFLAERLVAAQ
jgi:hypothetical protein